jgi:hypothetical protein
VGQSGVLWRKTWLVLVDDVKLFYTVGAYQLNPFYYECGDLLRNDGP